VEDLIKVCSSDETLVPEIVPSQEGAEIGESSIFNLISNLFDTVIMLEKEAHSLDCGLLGAHLRAVLLPDHISLFVIFFSEDDVL